MKSTTVATLLLVAAVTLRSGEAQSCTCKKANAKLNDASDQTACRSLSSSQSAPEMMDWMVRALEVQRATQKVLLETINSICDSAKLPCSSKYKFLEMSIDGVPSDVPESAYIDCYLDQIEIQASDQAKAMVDAYRREYAKGDVAVFNNLAVKGIHIDNDYFMGCTHSNITQTLKVRTSSNYADWLSDSKGWKDGVLTADEITGSHNGKNATAIIKKLINAQAQLLGVDPKFITIKKITKSSPSSGRRVLDSDTEVNLEPMFAFSGDALQVAAIHSARNKFY